MTRTDITAELTAVFREILDDDRFVLNDDMTADDVARWDPLHHLVLIATVDSTFRATEIEQLTTVGYLTGTVERRSR